MHQTPTMTSQPQVDEFIPNQTGPTLKCVRGSKEVPGFMEIELTSRILLPREGVWSRGYTNQDETSSLREKLL